MLKSIPKSNISRRSFKVYKKFTASQADYPVIKAFSESGLFDSETFTKATGLSEDVIAKMNNISEMSWEELNDLVSEVQG